MNILTAHHETETTATSEPIFLSDGLYDDNIKQSITPLRIDDAYEFLIKI
jgi:hypothetical protein